MAFRSKVLNTETVFPQIRDRVIAPTSMKKPSSSHALYSMSTFLYIRIKKIIIQTVYKEKYVYTTMKGPCA
jgi:hypothetical protein